MSRGLIMVSLLALPLLAAVAGAQSIPSLFIGTVTKDGEPLPNAQIEGRIAGEVCAQSQSGPDGSYGLPIPDKTTRAEICSEPNQQVDIFVNGAHVDTTTVGAPGIPVQREVEAGGTPPSPTATSTPSTPSGPLFTLAFNGEATTGANSVAVIGGTVTVKQVQAEAEKQSGRGVLALWLFADGEWKVFVPNLVEQFTSVTPPRALFVILN